jgi:hypothetical protein
MNVTYTDSDSGVPFVANFITHAGDVPAVQHDGHEVCVQRTVEAALVVPGRCCCMARIIVFRPAFVQAAVVLLGTTRICKHMHSQ